MKLETIIKNLTEAYEGGLRDLNLKVDIIGINDILDAKDVHEKTFQKWKANLIAWADVLAVRCWNDRLLLEKNLKPLGFEVVLRESFQYDASEKDYKNFYGSGLKFFYGEFSIIKITESQYCSSIVNRITEFKIGFDTKGIDGKAYPTGLIYRCHATEFTSLEEAIQFLKPEIKRYYVNN